MPKHTDTVDLVFPKPCHRFLRELAAHNDRAWFAANREHYHRSVLEPARDFVRAAGRALRRWSPEIYADPRANGQGSISRIQRDTRFSADKTPYRTFLGLLFWQGARERKWDSPCYHLVLTPGLLKLSAGIRVFAPAQLGHWRQSSHDPRLHRLLDRLEKAGVTIGGSHYKRIPQGAEMQNERHGELLLHRGVFATFQQKIRVSFHGEEFLAFCLETWRTMRPLNKWLAEMPE